jgi:2-polyprenyl-3-methyl-5-hydroxy-6-metoxy-1,4-benzoquinol methylase
MIGMSDVLRPSAEEALRAWAARVRANREQVDQFREATPRDFYAPVAGMFRADPRRSDDPALDALRKLVRADDVILDIGAGGGRLALPLALVARQVVAIEPSEGMLRVLRESIAEYSVSNIEVVDSRWPADITQGDVALISHLGYDVEDIGPFLEAMESAARRLCVAVLLEQPPPTEADRLWPAIHGVERAALPALPEFLALLLARGRLFELQLVERQPQTYAQPDQLLTWLRQQLWTTPDGPKDFRLQEVLREQLQERDGQLALTWAPVRIGIVTWHT